jgi:hypothetical protein
MEWGNLLKVASLIGILGFVTSAGSSFLLAFCVRDTFLSFVFGIVFCGCAFISLIVVFAIQSSFSIRFITFTISLFSLGGGLLLLLVDPNYHLKASYFNRLAVYLHIILPAGWILTSGWLLLTRPLMGSILDASKMDRAEELVLYLSTTFVASFALAAVFPGAPGVTVVEISTNALMWAIAVWFFAGIISAAVGVLIERRGDKGLAAAQSEMQPATSKPSHAVAASSSRT